MKIRTIATIFLSLFISASIAYMVVRETGIVKKSTDVRNPSNGAEAAGGSHKDPGATEGRTVTVYYFHSNFRCPTCLKIESLTASTLQSNFSTELANGSVAWKPVNIELPQNRHFVDDFKLFTKSVVVVDSMKGKQTRWKNLDRIWRLVRDDATFIDYIRDEVGDYLGNK